MKYEELIKSLRHCGEDVVSDCNNCPLFGDCDSLEYPLLHAADALEAAEKRIAELEDDLRNRTISNPERFKIYGYKLRDLILFADMCKRNNVEAEDMKQAAWNLEFAVRAVMNERADIVKNTMNETTMQFTPDFVKAFDDMMPNCGSKMDG